jgi:hypothetical protein
LGDGCSPELREAPRSTDLRLQIGPLEPVLDKRMGSPIRGSGWGDGSGDASILGDLTVRHGALEGLRESRNERNVFRRLLNPSEE